MNGLGLAALVFVVLGIFAAAVTFDHRAAGRRAPDRTTSPSTPQPDHTTSPSTPQEVP